MIESIQTVNFEVTTCCPLHCPQCYCSFEKSQHLALNTAYYWLEQCHKAGIHYISLSGGETACYPNLFDVIKEAKKYDLHVSAAFSGIGFNDSFTNKLIQSGIDHINISLNGSKEEINCLTRDGYHYAIEALTILKKIKFKSTGINWVMHSNNTEDFKGVIQLAEQYNVDFIDIIMYKPNSYTAITQIPNAEQMTSIVSYIRSYNGPVKIIVEKCFSQLNALLGNLPFFGNLNIGKFRGCLAGVGTFSINVDGTLSPCRHINIHESFSSIEDYWENSPTLDKIRHSWADVTIQCQECTFFQHCKPCQAINYATEHRFFFGCAICKLHNYS